MRRFIGLIKDHRVKIGRIIARTSKVVSYGCESKDKDR